MMTKITIIDYRLLVIRVWHVLFTCSASSAGATGEALLASGSYWTLRSGEPSEPRGTSQPGSTSRAGLTHLTRVPCTTTDNNLFNQSIDQLIKVVRIKVKSYNSTMS